MARFSKKLVEIYQSYNTIALLASLFDAIPLEASREISARSANLCWIPPIPIPA
jgi:hypothetical protein